MPNVDSSTIDRMLELDNKFDNVYAMMGIHPCSINSEYKEELKIVENNCKKRDFSAVGEIGIDLYWEKKYYAEQVKAFEWQIDLAINLRRPIVIHSRESIDLCIDIVESRQKGGLKGVFHCFTGDVEQSKKIIDLGFVMGIGGVLTYKNSKLDEVVKNIDINEIVLETDAPYLTPAPFRGKKNKPEYLIYIAKKLAEIKEMNLGEVSKITTKNANLLFSMHQK